MVAPEHTGTFIVMVVLLVADGTFNIHRLLRGGAGAGDSSIGILPLKDLDNVPSHDGAVLGGQQCQTIQFPYGNE